MALVLPKQFMSIDMPEIKNFTGIVCKFNEAMPDKRIISKDAFKQCDGKTVPLTTEYRHGDPESVLGRATVEIHDDGIYAKCSLYYALSAEMLDYISFGIYADSIASKGKTVVSGRILAVNIINNEKEK